MDFAKFTDDELLYMYKEGKSLKIQVKAEIERRGLSTRTKKVRVNTLIQMIDFLRLCGFPSPVKSVGGHLVAVGGNGCWEWFGEYAAINGYQCAPMDSPNESIFVTISGVSKEYLSFSAMVNECKDVDFSKALKKYAA